MRRKHHLLQALALAALMGGLASALSAGLAAASPNNAELVCSSAEPAVSPARWLRSASLDLRGALPTPDETAAVIEAGEEAEVVLAAFVAEWLSSPDFAQRALRFHRDLLWPNIDTVNLLPAVVGLRIDGGIYWRNSAAAKFRGLSVQCLDEPAEFNGAGAIIAKPQSDGTQREGWVWVSPYWAPETTIRVCAYDAQEALVSPNGTACNTNFGQQEVACGCGPNLSFCRYGLTQRNVLRGWIGDLERRVLSVIEEGRPYTDLFTDRTMYINGPLAHYYRWQSAFRSAVRMEPLAVEPSTIPELDYTEYDNWVQIETDEHHAGILTAPGYLLRFQTNRSRANRFYNAFLCQPFQPPDDGLEPSAEAALQPDLQKRDGCQWCHTTLEPAAAYWGRWTEVGGGYLDPETFPALREDCLLCASTGAACSDACNRYYLTQPLAPEELFYLGQLNAYVFRYDSHMPNIEYGPALLALTKTVDNQLPYCVTAKTAGWILGRELTSEDAAHIDEWAVAFAASNFDFRALVEAIVLSETYGRVQ